MDATLGLRYDLLNARYALPVSLVETSFLLIQNAITWEVLRRKLIFELALSTIVTQQRRAKINFTMLRMIEFLCFFKMKRPLESQLFSKFEIQKPLLRMIEFLVSSNEKATRVAALFKIRNTS